ncbi:hypothetical protein [Legionella spiritensis]|uniref:Uncharacterized protein n=1 Tax=Legionella spiritensis TaxID=452 RepID=A0A0W0ZAH5_LEGSP|nr:hypothetical protein [Legionella spiritensis]KTD66130.1 hypothetical protein Lspi_0193 [Legionella spiritensis]SNV44023.1 Uncharacterised protein [Legionella spiritensis]
MYKKLIVSAFSMAGFMMTPVFADNLNSCSVQVAVATPPIQLDENVAFNVTGEGFNKSITLQGGSAPQYIDNIPCTDIPYFISATSYPTPSNGTRANMPPVGQCQLKAGAVVLNGSGNSVSVVFPNDFICNS